MFSTRQMRTPAWHLSGLGARASQVIQAGERSGASGLVVEVKAHGDAQGESDGQEKDGAVPDEDGDSDVATSRETPLTRVVVSSGLSTSRGGSVTISADALTRAQGPFTGDKTRGSNTGIEQEMQRGGGGEEKETPADGDEVAAGVRQAGQGPAIFSTGTRRAVHVPPGATARARGMFDPAPGEMGPSPTVTAL